MAIDQKLLVQLRRTFFPYASDATDRMTQLGGRFVYYTTAATAIKILSGREIWMRNTLVMNDFMEVEHGLRCVIDAYHSSAGTALEEALEACCSGISTEIKSLFDAWTPGIRMDTFVTCLSEHRPEEDEHGRLSMWRAYGGLAGVALVLNGGAMFRPSDALAAYSSPVGYFGREGVEAQLRAVAANIQSNTEFVRSLGREGLKQTVFGMLRYGAICTKHPAFREECEWRIVASPAMQASPHLPSSVEVVGGIPQTILKLKLADHPEQGLYGLTPPDLIDRVLIGPCEHADVVSRALWQALSSAGVADPQSKVVVTGVPLRANQRG